MIGQTLAGRYQITSHLGGGAFGQTYLAEDTQLPDKNQCVVKHLKPQASDPLTLQAARRLFETEAQVLNRLGNHDQIPRLLAHFEENQEFYLVQDFIEGQSLSQILTPGKRLSEAEVINLLQEILEILEFVHHEGVIHRDIKPSNLIRRKQDGKLVLIDFGAVKQISTQVVNAQGQANFTIAVGTEGYMPSEQAKGKPRLASDIYAVGIIGIQSLTGISPRELPEDSQTGEIIWRDRLRISPRLGKVLDTMARSSFSRRYQNASEALQAVKALKSGIDWLSFFRRVDIIGLLGLLIAVITLLATPQTRQEIGQFLKIWLPPELYEDSASGIKIKYPKDWEAKEPEIPFFGDVIRFSPKARVSDAFQPELIISVESLKQPMSLDKYTTSSIDAIITSPSSSKPKIIRSVPTTLAHKPAHKVIYTYEDRNLKLKSMSVWALINNQAYILTYTAEASKYAKFLTPVEEVMIKSFEVD